MRTRLHQGWTVRALGGEVPDDVAGRAIPARVPGCVTTDLLAAGLVPDPYLDDNEARLAWIGRTDWRYETTFEAPAPSAGERVDLVCEGLDTIATVVLNGTEVARTANMHRTYRFDVGAVLRAGTNELQITFRAPLDAAEEMSEAEGPRPQVNTHPFNAIRKMACNYGWDWGPDLPTAGIWRPISLQRWRSARLASVRPLVSVDLAGTGPASGRVDVHVEVERAPGEHGPLAVTARVGEATATAAVAGGSSAATLRVEVAAVELWWPVGYGAQPLSDVEVRLEAGAVPSGAAALDVWSGRVGFRSVRLDATPDDIGTSLAIVVNGQTIAVRGANWIPDDCFVDRISRDQYRRALRDATEANMNLLRVWGGGIYESDDFYDAADELGLLVWQDFLFACAAYSEEDPLRSEVVAEAREAVTRLSPHPSLAVWNGCNENIWGREEWGWIEPLGDMTWGAGYYFEILPAIVAELDPTRPYSAGSPWSFGADAKPNDPRHGSMHVWDVWNQKDYTAYADYAPRFVAEFGFQGPPAWSTLTGAVHDDPLRTDGPQMLVHQKAGDGMGKLERGLAPHLPAPASIEDWHWATSLNQARAVSFGIDRWRSQTPRCNGTIVWQLNDCWPVISWAAVDGAGRRKPLWYALRRSYRDRVLTIQPAGDGLAVVAVNDSGTPWRATVGLTRQDFAGTVLASSVVVVEAGPGQAAAAVVPVEVAAPGDPSGEVLVAVAGDRRALHLYREDKDLALPAPRLETAVVAVAGGYDVTVTARSLQRDLALLADKVAPDATVDEMLVTLLAGESTTFHVTTAATVPTDALVAPRVLRSANQLVAVPG